MYLHRTLNLTNLLNKKSFFLLGPRATGKTSLIINQLPNTHLVINLLKTDIFLRLNARPWELEELINAAIQNTGSTSPPIVVIDEIQNIPLLLNEVHRLIEEKNITFLLTGSSARKLKNPGTNLLAGRAWQAQLFPLTFQEIPNFSLIRYLQFGGLPTVYLSEDPTEMLIAYINTYLKEEIQAEAFVRKIHAFSKFLQMVALTNGQIINFTALANDTAIPASTIREYYQILQDTLIGFLLPAWTHSQKRKAISTAKFYFFDLGVCNQLREIKTIEKNSELFGSVFEHFIALELRAFLSYYRTHASLRYWNSTSGYEVDFIINQNIAIEVKSTVQVTQKHLKGLRALQEENIFKKLYLISCDPVHRISQGIEIIYWQDFLSHLEQKILPYLDS